MKTDLYHCIGHNLYLWETIMDNKNR